MSLSVEEVKEYIEDKAEKNHLLDGEEFSPTQITLAMDLALSSWNMITPITSDTLQTFPANNKSLLLFGTLWHLFSGAAALAARNTMAYSDGGLSIPVEEKFELYRSLAAMYQAYFQDSAQKVKIQNNMEAGWGEVRSDQANFPLW